ncbi:hypothetical protein [Clostridium rectalis]|uniref:hypothetical protein n=1 Tax=Clostridium rectalis TaxID=2040295 RepID=UPI000F62D153|nr:hypothetical protein [Clostridium rectalis]
MNSGNKQIEANNLKVISDQLNYEALMNKKFSLYGQYCTDQQLKDLCNQSAGIHKQNFNELKTYLESHQ